MAEKDSVPQTGDKFTHGKNSIPSYRKGGTMKASGVAKLHRGEKIRGPQRGGKR